MQYANDGGRDANPAALSSALATLWRMIESDRFDDGLLKREYDVCVSLMPDYDKHYIQGQEEAEDAVLSIAYAIRTQVDDAAKYAELAAEKAYDSLDHYLIERYAIDLDEPRVRHKIEAYPIMQRELQRQQADLAELQEAAQNSGRERAVISRIKQRAEQDAAPLDQLPLDQVLDPVKTHLLNLLRPPH